MKKGDVTSSQLPFIRRRESKLCPVRGVLDEKELVVQGKDLAECKKVFDEEWEK